MPQARLGGSHPSTDALAARLVLSCKQHLAAGAGYGSGAAAEAGTSQGYGSGYGSMAAGGASGSYADTAYGSGSGYNSYQQARPVLFCHAVFCSGLVCFWMVRKAGARSAVLCACRYGVCVLCLALRPRWQTLERR